MNENNFNGISSAESPQVDYQDIIGQLEAVLTTDFLRLRYLVQQNVITPNQGKYLLEELKNKANALKSCKENIPLQPISQTKPDTQEEQIEEVNSLELFQKENPDFFSNESRIDLLNYLKSVDADKDEITKIVKLAENLEKSAIDNYLKKSEHEKILSEANDTAKRKLTSYVQNTAPDGKFNKIFTRDDLGNMSNNEFAQNEKLIFDQIKHGLIK